MVESMACSLSPGVPRLTRISNAASHTPILLQRVKCTKTVSIAASLPVRRAADYPRMLGGRPNSFRVLVLKVTRIDLLTRLL
jgi:hypothetical protein